VETLRLDPSAAGMLGLARRAGALLIGMDRLREAVRLGRPLLILADPALSPRSWRELEEWRSRTAGTRVVAVAGMADLNGALGTTGVKAVGLAAGAFRRGLEQGLDRLNTGDKGGSQEA